MRFPRIVVTGFGCLTPLGKNVEENHSQILKSSSFFRKISQIPNLQNPQSYPQEQFVSAIDLTQKEFEENSHTFNKTRSSAFLNIALLEALKTSNIDKQFISQNANRVGISVGSLSSNLSFLNENIAKSINSNFSNLHRFTMMNVLNNILSTRISAEYGIKGPTIVPSTACATGLSSIGEAFNLIRLGYADLFICGGVEEILNPLSVWGPIRLGAMNQKPTNGKICAPFDFERNGIILGEAAGVMVIESLESAKSRNAHIIAEIIDFGMSSDGFHFVKPEENGEGAYRAIKMAGKKLENMNIDPSQILINAHATGTIAGDKAELSAYNKFVNELFENKNFEEKVIVSANKGNFGHTFSAAGLLESIMGIKSLINGQVPGTNFFERTEIQNDKLYLSKNTQKDKNFQFLMKSSFGFGGINCAILFEKFNQ